MAWLAKDEETRSLILFCIIWTNHINFKYWYFIFFYFVINYFCVCQFTYLSY
jgi:hypothetical protein